jgi:hypothetical protein
MRATQISHPGILKYSNVAGGLRLAELRQRTPDEPGVLAELSAGRSAEHHDGRGGIGGQIGRSSRSFG